MAHHGGLALPDIWAYYLVVHLGRLIDLCRHHETKLWAQLEQAQSIVPLGKTPWCFSALPELKRHPLIGNSIRICAQLVSRPSLSSPNSPIYTILGNPQFTSDLHDVVFRGLSDAGLHQASHFSSGGRLKTITELSDPTGPFCLDFLKSLQLRPSLTPYSPPPKAANRSQHSNSVLTLECYHTQFLLHKAS